MKALERLKVTAFNQPSDRIQIRALAEVEVGPYKFERGGNSFKANSPADSYKKAEELIKILEQHGYKYTPHGTMSKTMDVFVSGSNEIAVSVRNKLVNVDVW